MFKPTLEPFKQINPQKITQVLIDAFSESDLRDLCFELGITYSDLPGDTRYLKTISLTNHFIEKHQLFTLTESIKRFRPTVDIHRVEVLSSFPISTYIPSKEKLNDIEKLELLAEKLGKGLLRERFGQLLDDKTTKKLSLINVRDALTTYFDEAELQSLCFDLGLDL
jgi:hypothetical protein